MLLHINIQIAWLTYRIHAHGHVCIHFSCISTMTSTICSPTSLLMLHYLVSCLISLYSTSHMWISIEGICSIPLLWSLRFSTHAFQFVLHFHAYFKSSLLSVSLCKKPCHKTRVHDLLLTYTLAMHVCFMYLLRKSISFFSYSTFLSTNNNLSFFTVHTCLLPSTVMFGHHLTHHAYLMIVALFMFVLPSCI